MQNVTAQLSLEPMTSERKEFYDDVQVIAKSAELCAPPTSTVEMEDPFDDPALVTNVSSSAFMYSYTPSYYNIHAAEQSFL